VRAQSLGMIVAVSVIAAFFIACGNGTNQSTDPSTSETSNVPDGSTSASSNSATDGSGPPDALGSESASADSGAGSSGAQTGSSGTSSGLGSDGGSDASGSGAADAGAPGIAPCDLYQSAGTPCVAAHSTVRALYGSYDGSLYQVRRHSDGTTRNIAVRGPGGFADTSVQDSFCSGTSCTISVLYDQSPNHNDLAKSPVAYWLPEGGTESSATAATIKVSGQTVHGVYVTGFSTNVAYRNNTTRNLATRDEPEAMYMVVDGTRFDAYCCFDYGNAETDGKDDGNATMEALYWGSSTQWSRGGGNGPWVAADLENGMFEGDSTNTPSNTPVNFPYATAMLKGPSGNSMALKAGNAQSGALAIKWNGARPSGYSPMKKQGAIILGTGGDGSQGGTGTFFEGAMTSGNPPDAIDDAVQRNIVSAGYGR
jgi:hypothetical protein